MSNGYDTLNDEIINNLVSVVNLDKKINKSADCNAELSLEKLKSICQELLLRLHPDKKCQSSSLQSNLLNDSESSEFSDVLAAWKFLSNYSNDGDHELTRRILARQYEIVNENTGTVSKPLWKVILLQSFVTTDDDSMTHPCRCGGLFVLSNEDFDDLKAVLNEDIKTDSKASCELENENCECHELIEVECETCSLVIGVKIKLTE